MHVRTHTDTFPVRRAQGAYLKLLSADEAVPPAALNGDTAYTLMFGPDKCGAVHKTHFILRHKSPVDGAIKECHLVGETAAPPLSDKKPHLYTAVITPESEVKILVDGKEVWPRVPYPQSTEPSVGSVGWVVR